MKIYLATLGCKLNESELEAWSRRFAGEGYEVVADPQAADVCVLNTCTVTHVAARKSRQMARQLARSRPDARVILTGCYADISPDQARTLPNVALVVPNADKDRLVDLAGQLLADARFQTTETGCRLPEAASGTLASTPIDSSPSGLEFALAPLAAAQPSVLRTRAFVKVMDGCNKSCTYCIIPLARGGERSRPLTDVVVEVRALVRSGYQEIILTGVQISAYRDKSTGSVYSLRDLVAAILRETDVPRLRLTSIAPWDLDTELLDLWSDPRLCRHLHLSLQSGSDTVLRRMRRAYSTRQFAEAVALARSRVNDVGITTDVIVGFPGESDVEFEQSLDFVRAQQFSRVHVFPYSAREGTVAAQFPLQVAEPVKAARASAMQAVGQASARSFAERYLGREMMVLWESGQAIPDAASTGADGGVERVWSGYTDNYVRVALTSALDLGNRLAPARLVDLAEDGAIGRLYSNP